MMRHISLKYIELCCILLDSIVEDLAHQEGTTFWAVSLGDSRGGGLWVEDPEGKGPVIRGLEGVNCCIIHFTISHYVLYHILCYVICYHFTLCCIVLHWVLMYCFVLYCSALSDTVLNYKEYILQYASFC